MTMIYISDDDDGDEPLMLEDEAGLAEVLEACP